MLAAIFPGQGVQKVGMGKELLGFSVFSSFLKEKAKEHCLQDLLNLAFKGPETALSHTATLQPLLFLFNLAYFELFKQTFPRRNFSFFAGHSLGEYAALVASDVLDFEQGLSLVKKRGELMAVEAEKVKGGMVAVLKISQDEAEEISKETGVEIANFNSPQQFIFSGLNSGLNQVVEKVKEKGGKAIPLSVNGPFHSKYMKPAGEKFYSYLEQVEFDFKKAEKVVFNLTARPLQPNNNLRDILSRQIYSPVRWQQTIEYMAAEGVNVFVELGPGRVLTGLLKYILPAGKGLTFDNGSELDALNSVLRG